MDNAGEADGVAACSTEAQLLVEPEGDNGTNWKPCLTVEQLAKVSMHCLSPKSPM